MNAWWNEQTAALIGAIGGGGLGSLAGLVGAMSGTLAVKGRCKALVMGLHITLTLVGVAALAVGLYAKLIGQPGHVTFPLLLAGSILTVVCGCLLPLTVMVYALAHARQIDAPATSPSAQPVHSPIGQTSIGAHARETLVRLWGQGGSLRRGTVAGAYALGAVLLVALGLGTQSLIAGSSWFDWAALAAAMFFGVIMLLASLRHMGRLAAHMQQETEKQRLAAAEFRRT